MSKIKVLIADDHALIRQALKTLLDLSEDIKVIAEAGDGQGAINVCRTHEVDVVLLDINMPYVSGIEAAKIIKKEKPSLGIIALTVSDEEKDIQEMLQAGASAYLLKDIDADNLVAAIKKVNSGDSVLHPSITKKVINSYKEIAATVHNSKVILTEREKEILFLITEGLSNKEIAQKLFVSEKTVKNHLTHIFRKINVEDRTQAAIFAMKNKQIFN